MNSRIPKHRALSEACKRPAMLVFAAMTGLCGFWPHAFFAQAQSATPLHFKFDFGPGKVAPGYTQVNSEMLYTKERGFGFEPGAGLKAMDCVGEDPLRSDLVSSDKPFYFSVAVPDGNYRVTVKLGGEKSATDTTVFAELRRLMLEQVRTAPGKSETRSFIVNVRQPGITSGGAVRLKDREKTLEAWDWDDRLSLEFNGPHPAIAAMEIEKVNVPTLYLIGDSTVCDQSREPFNSWGQMITRFFKPEIAVANHAESGETIADSLSRHRFGKIWSEMRTGDYLFVQFGHNDMKSRAANALEIYTTDLRQVVDKTRQRGGVPVLIIPVSRRTFDNLGRITNSFGGYPDAVRLVAREKEVPLIDLQNMAAKFYEALGPEASHEAFANAKENTHHSDYGSYEIAQCVLDGIKENQLGLAGFIGDDFRGFDPLHPDSFQHFKLPSSSAVTTETPPGN